MLSHFMCTILYVCVKEGIEFLSVGNIPVYIEGYNMYIYVNVCVLYSYEIIQNVYKMFK